MPAAACCSSHSIAIALEDAGLLRESAGVTEPARSMRAVQAQGVAEVDRQDLSHPEAGA
jgi:hypothetical protein